METPTFLGQPRGQHTQFIPGFSTRYRPIWDPTAFSGTKGSKLIQFGITSSDTGANKLLLAKGKALTLQSNMGVGTFVDGGGGSDSITRTSGSFVSDGWLDGNVLQAIGATTLANDFRAVLTSVAALTATFATGTVSVQEALASGAKLYKLVQIGLIEIAAQAGTVSATASVNGLDTSEMPWINTKPNDYMPIAADEVLFGALSTALGTGEVVDVNIVGADY